MLRSLALYTALVFAANAAAAEGVGQGGAADPTAPTGNAAAAVPADAAPAEAAPSGSAPAAEAPSGPSAEAGASAPDAAASAPATAPPAAAPDAAAAAQPAAPADPPDFEAARAAGLSKLVETTPPAPVPAVAFSDLDGGTHSLADWKGKVLLVNFWATWCAPCRDEMPSLDALQKARGGDDFAVLTIAAGRNPPAAVTKFFTEENITDLPTLTDERTELARAFGVMAMPVTILIDAEGNEVARMTGDADWASPAAMTLVDQLRGQ